MTDRLSSIEIITKSWLATSVFMVVPFSALNISMNPRMVRWQALFVLFLVFLSHFMDTRGKLTSVGVSLCGGYLIKVTQPPFEAIVVD